MNLSQKCEYIVSNHDLYSVVIDTWLWFRLVSFHLNFGLQKRDMHELVPQVDIVSSHDLYSVVIDTWLWFRLATYAAFASIRG